MTSNLAPTLTVQIQKHCSRIELAINQLTPTDPLRTWCSYELKMLIHQGKHEVLQDAGAILHGLRQLEHLLFEHNVRLRNPTDTPSDDLSEESLPTASARLPANVQAMVKEHRFSIDPQLMFHPTWKHSDFDPVSPTAKVVSYLRSRDPQLQIAEELNMEQEGQQILSGSENVEEQTESLMASLFQSRHHAVNVSIAATGTKQIIELAAGISPRGLQWARAMPDTIYVESDLPALMIRKAKLLRDHILSSPKLNAGHLHCCAIYVLDLSSWQSAFDSIDCESPFVIVSEGLLLYFKKAELLKFLQHMHKFLSRYPNAVWVTDFVTRADLRALIATHPGVAQAVRQTFAMTGRSVISENPLESEACVTELIAECGLQVVSTVRLSDCLRNPTTGTETSGVAGQRKIWTLTRCQQVPPIDPIAR